MSVPVSENTHVKGSDRGQSHFIYQAFEEMLTSAIL